MIRSVLQRIGVLVFWMAWPVWFVYFKNSHERSRVLLIHKGEVLLVKGWLGTNKWGLPGGGAHKAELPVASAVRELREEVGYLAAETALRSLGAKRHNTYHLKYRAHYFVLELAERPVLKIRPFEISEARWFEAKQIIGTMLDEDAAYALRKYKPLDQTELLPSGGAQV